MLIHYISSVLSSICFVFSLLSSFIGMTIFVEYLVSYDITKQHRFSLKQLVIAFICTCTIAIITSFDLEHNYIDWCIKTYEEYKTENDNLRAEIAKLQLYQTPD